MKETLKILTNFGDFICGVCGYEHYGSCGEGELERCKNCGRLFIGEIKLGILLRYIGDRFI